MIPKKIHYCWFGGNPLPELAVKCIESWKKFLPEYEIVEWNESNFPLADFQFAREAHESRKFAFASDVARLYAMKEQGGLYMDTDVEVLKPLDRFLHHSAFSGFENGEIVPTGLMGTVKDGKWINDLLNYYRTRSFYKADGSFDMKTINMIITEMMVEKGFRMNDVYQEIDDYVAFYPTEYFCPKNYITGVIEVTENSYCIHHFAMSWVSSQEKWRSKLKLKAMKLLGVANVQKAVDLLKRI